MKAPFLTLWGWPIGFGVLTCIGLIAALLGDGWWDLVSAVTLGAPVLACGWYCLKR
ncbi:hypothetical protein [Massilia mucilaginosa]|uniref:hypothetical protein n=1 Tax=Massilia mucilaginosa TaxID=2609282 RepID=UPI00141F9B7D|nr:hypothetical protein [Massilia mucilaginosa]